MAPRSSGTMPNMRGSAPASRTSPSRHQLLLSRILPGPGVSAAPTSSLPIVKTPTTGRRRTGTPRWAAPAEASMPRA